MHSKCETFFILENSLKDGIVRTMQHLYKIYSPKPNGLGKNNCVTLSRTTP